MQQFAGDFINKAGNDAGLGDAVELALLCHAYI